VQLLRQLLVAIGKPIRAPFLPSHFVFLPFVGAGHQREPTPILSPSYSVEDT
jgi:hypothetical protein